MGITNAQRNISTVSTNITDLALVKSPFSFQVYGLPFSFFIYFSFIFEGGHKLLLFIFSFLMEYHKYGLQHLTALSQILLYPLMGIQQHCYKAKSRVWLMARDTGATQTNFHV